MTSGIAITRPHYRAGRGGRALLYAVDKWSGEELGSVEIPAPASSVPMSHMHQGEQYIVIPIGGGPGNQAGALATLTLPERLAPSLVQARATARGCALPPRPGSYPLFPPTAIATFCPSSAADTIPPA